MHTYFLSALLPVLLSLVSFVHASEKPPVLQDPAQLVAQAEALLMERAANYPGTASVIVHSPRLVNQGPCEQMEAFLPRTGSLQSNMTVGIRCLAPNPWTVYLQANLKIQGHYFVANRQIDRGEVLSLDDLDAREGDLLRQRRAISDPAHIVGWISTRRIRAGSPIETHALRSPDSIERGQKVQTVARGKGFVATGEGMALESGNPGSQIQVRSSSGQIITGTVIDAQTVQVLM